MEAFSELGKSLPAFLLLTERQLLFLAYCVRRATFSICFAALCPLRAYSDMGLSWDHHSPAKEP